MAVGVFDAGLPGRTTKDFVTWNEQKAEGKIAVRLGEQDKRFEV